MLDQHLSLLTVIITVDAEKFARLTFYEQAIECQIAVAVLSRIG